MKLKRKKIGDRNYDLIDTASGSVIANAVQTGEHGRDNYPWSWDMSDDRIFGRLGISTGGSADSLKYVVDYVESLADAYGLLMPAVDIRPQSIKEGQVFRVIKRGIRHFYRATQDAYYTGTENVLITANDQKGELTELRLPSNEDVTLYLPESEARREKALVEALEEVANVPAARQELEGTFKQETALAAMVRKLDKRDKRTSRGYVTQRDELIAILQEVSKRVSVSIIEDELPYAQGHKEISVTIKLGLTLERDLL